MVSLSTVKSFCLSVVVIWTTPVHATIYYSGDKFAEMPAQWKGFLADHRQLRLAGAPASTKLIPLLLRQEYQANLDRLLARRATLSANELSDAGALALRLGQTDTALNILQAAVQQHPQHFALRANLGSAWHLVGNYAQAIEQLTQAIALASPEQKPLEQLHLQLVRQRLLGEKGVDRLFPFTYSTGQGHRLGKLPAEELKKLPGNAVALVQKLALSFPQDGMHLWQLGELACIYGDYATASELFDLCIGEYGLSNPALRQSRQAIKAVMERNTIKQPAEQQQLHEQHGAPLRLEFKSRRPLIPKPLDVSALGSVKPGEPSLLLWPILAETATTPNRFAPRFHTYLQKLSDKPVTLTGFLHPLTDDLECTSFLLVENPIGCWYCTAPDLTGLVFITMKENSTARFTRDVIQVTGKLKLNSNDPDEFMFSIVEASVNQPR